MLESDKEYELNKMISHAGCLLRDLPEEATGKIPKHLQMVSQCSMELTSSNPIGLNLLQNFLLIRYLVHRHVFGKTDAEINWSIPELH